MKARELMPGDIVSLFGNACIIDGLSISEGTLRIEGDTVHYYCDMQEIEPVPLTAEILDKNGWTLLANFGGEAYWSENGEFHLPYNKGQYRIIIHGIVIKITYVHELQHALRLCGLDYIADNFKIK